MHRLSPALPWGAHHVPADKLLGMLSLAEGKRAGVQGYMPTDLYNLNSGYGSADSLKRCAAVAMSTSGIGALRGPPQCRPLL
jgi:hypothetical protein